MRIICRHGYFYFFPKSYADVSDFCRFYDVILTGRENFFTFPFIADAPNYSLENQSYLGLVANTTYGGKNASEVFKENGFVYNLSTKTIVPKTSINISINPQIGRTHFIVDAPILQPGSLSKQGQRLSSYSGEYLFSNKRIRIDELIYE